MAVTKQQFHLDPAITFFYSFDISNLFTNITPAEAIQIFADTLYNSELTLPTIPTARLAELLMAATTLVEFSFNNAMYTQIDDVTMGSLLATIFVG